MKKKKRISVVIATMLIITIMTGLVLHAALAANPPEPYTVMVKYYDSVSINYALRPDIDKFHGYDVPIGGIGIIDPANPAAGFSQVVVHQAYCIDPFVPFARPPDGETINHGYIGPVITNTHPDAAKIYRPVGGDFYNNYTETSGIFGENWPVTTTHTRSDYYAATPWVLSDAMKKYGDAICWLVYNGYRGDFRTHGLPPLSNDDGESEESLRRINRDFGGSPNPLDPNYIDKQMALTATKVAIWTILTQDDPGSFQLDPVKGTSMHGVIFDGVDRGEVFENLLKQLVDGANANNSPNAPTLGYTDLTMSINIPNILDLAHSDANFVYYPLSVTVNIINPSGDVSGAGIDVFLTAAGPFAREVRFAKLTGGSYIELPSKELPGTAQPYQFDSGTFSSASYTTNDLFLRVPRSRLEALGPDGIGSELLRIRAWAHGEGIPAREGTPLPIAAMSGDGVQDWNIVQAFIGATRQGAEINMYAETFIDTRNNHDGELVINKRLQEIIQVDTTRDFTFSLFYNYEPNFNTAHQVDLDIHSITPGTARIGDTNLFRLRHDQTVRFTDLPGHFYYWIVEHNEGMGDFRAPWYEFSSGIPEAGVRFPARAVSSMPVINGFRTCFFELDDAGTATRAEITLTNTKEEGNGGGNGGNGGGGGGNGGERAVQTGVDRNMTIPLILLLVAAIALGVAELYRRKFKEKANK